MPSPAWKLIVVEGPDPGLERLLAELAISIGRGRSDDLVLSDPGVTRQQLRLEWNAEENCHVLEQTGDSPTLVNNIPAARLAAIGHRVIEGDQVQIGSTVRRFVSSATDVLPPSAPS